MLDKLYSETGLLVRDVEFHPGINIILGKYSGDNKARGINGIGKSSLVRLIDYAFISDKAEKIFNKPQYDFLRTENHNIVLEFKVEDQTFFIKRYFQKTDIIYFGKDPNDLNEYNSTDMKKILMAKLFPVENNSVFLEGTRFRSLMNFFIKDDLKNQERIDPTNFVSSKMSQKKLAVYNFFLLNLSTKSIIEYNEMSDEYETYSKTINGLEEKIKIDTGKSIQEFQSDRFKIEDQITLLEKSLGDYKFLEAYKNVEDRIIEITTAINDKLAEYHSFNQKLKRVKESYRLSPELDTKEIRNLYNEVLFSFGDMVAKTLDEIQTFKRGIIENRNRYLITREKQFETTISQILAEISRLEIERSELYKKLEEKGALQSITNTYEQLISAKTDLDRNLYTLGQVNEIQEMLGNLDVSISKAKADIINHLRSCESELHELRRLFQEILKNAIFVDEDFRNAYFDISPRKKPRRNQLPFSMDVEIPKVDALGQSRLKIVAYDLMVFLNNIGTGRIFPGFLVHDGVFHAISRKTVINTLNYIFHRYLKNPTFQYIVTFNEDEINIPGDQQDLYGTFAFDWNKQVIAVYEDIPEKMLFKREFQ